jgi:hypothetical protein
MCFQLGVFFCSWDVASREKKKRSQVNCLTSLPVKQFVVFVGVFFPGYGWTDGLMPESTVTLISIASSGDVLKITNDSGAMRGQTL